MFHLASVSKLQYWSSHLFYTMFTLFFLVLFDQTDELERGRRSIFVVKLFLNIEFSLWKLLMTSVVAFVMLVDFLKFIEKFLCMWSNLWPWAGTNICFDFFPIFSKLGDGYIKKRATIHKALMFFFGPSASLQSLGLMIVLLHIYYVILIKLR